MLQNRTVNERIQKVTDNDLEQIHKLLDEVNLPVIGITDHLENFFFIEDEGVMIGLIGLEIYKNIGLLRSVAVKPSYQGNKIGNTLVEYIIDYAQNISLERIYLFTDTADKWFERYEFVKIASEELDPLLENSKEFTLCSQSVRMVKSLI